MSALDDPAVLALCASLVHKGLEQLAAAEAEARKAQGSEQVPEPRGAA